MIRPEGFHFTISENSFDNNKHDNKFKTAKDTKRRVKALYNVETPSDPLHLRNCIRNSQLALYWSRSEEGKPSEFYIMNAIANWSNHKSSSDFNCPT